MHVSCRTGADIVQKNYNIHSNLIDINIYVYNITQRSTQIQS